MSDPVQADAGALTALRLLGERAKAAKGTDEKARWYATVTRTECWSAMEYQGLCSDAQVTRDAFAKACTPDVILALVQDAEQSAADTGGVRLIAAERARQIAAEGWTPEHDDTHRLGEMAITAACYAANGTDAEVLVGDNDAWPWGSCHDKRRKHPRIRQLAIAGALIAAEIDRLTREAHAASTTEPTDA